MVRLRTLSYCLIALIVLATARTTTAQLSFSYTVDGIDAGKQFGTAVAYIGETTDSLIPAFAVGGFYADSGYYGWVYFFATDDGTLIESRSGGNTTRGDLQAYGCVLGGGKDFNGLGSNDVIIASPYGWGSSTADYDAGDVEDVRGEELWNGYKSCSGTAAGQEMGSSVDMIDDVTGDTYADVVIGARSLSNFVTKGGGVYVYSPELDVQTDFFNLLSGVTVTYNDTVPYGMFGWSVAALGDVNGDGVPDFIAGAPGDGSGTVTAGVVMCSGGTPYGRHWQKRAGSAGTRFGYAVANAGLLDGDSYEDVVVGEPATADDSGYVWAFSGQTGDTIWYTVAPNANDSLGTSLVGIGDVDGDLIGDIAAGAAGGNGGTGCVYILSGANGAIIDQLNGENAGDQFGYDLSSGDCNGDGSEDLLVGAPGYASDDGRVYVYLAGVPGVTPPSVPEPLTVYAFSPVDLVVTDPIGDSIGIGFNTIGAGSGYDTLTDENSSTLTGPDGDPDDIVSIPTPYEGDYRIRIIREPSAADGDKFSLSIRINGNQLYTPDGYFDQPVSSLGSVISDTYVYRTATTIAGDVNADSSITSSDIIYMVNYVFKGGTPPVVPEHGDVNCDGNDTSADIIYLVGFVFKSGPSPCSQTTSG